MKKALLLLAVAMLTLTVSCKKEKNCRCAAMGTQNENYLDITTIIQNQNAGTCPGK